MRTPVMFRFVRNSVATTTAALTLGIALPLLTGGTSAWAVCGSDLHDAGRTPAPAHQGELSVTQNATFDSITAGGATVEIPVRITNTTDAAYERVEPMIGLAHFVNGHDLNPTDVKVSWKQGKGGWHALPLQPGCTRGIVNKSDTLPMLKLGKGESADITFRFSVPADVRKDLDWFDYSLSAQGEDNKSGTALGTLTVVHPIASAKPTAPEPTATATKPAGAAVVPAAVTTAAATADTQATQAAPATPAAAEGDGTTELASTGSNGPTTVLAAAGAVLIVIGGGAHLVLRRRAAER
ncbi:hypothetical protein [Kitasatospora camelliae]|uniref:LPXTG-motif cell wall-anchored protein n=1 Tax=Kitasatospora camelliae TaxID=3156397 RepID=A0AAU8K2C1_9ACTN